MDFSSAQYLQLIAGLSFVLIAFIAAYLGPERGVIALVILLLPFQLITSKFGSVNTGLALIVFTAFLMNGRLKRFPLLLVTGMVFLAYLISYAQALRPTFPDHLYYMIAMSANFALFFIVYNYIVRSGNVRGFFNLLMWLNILVDIYCFAQLLIGVDPGFGGDGDMLLRANRADARLAGPFAAVGITAEYLVIQTFLLAHMYMHEPKKGRKLLLVGIVLANLTFLVATGNRGGFLVLIGGGLLYLFMFRREFGVGPLIGRVVAGAFMLGAVSLVVLNSTEFNVLFERLQATEITAGVPDTREAIWAHSWERIGEAPLTGHGPRIRLVEEPLRRIRGHKFMPYPHSGYLFILYTLGIVGLLAWTAFFSTLYFRFRKAKKNLHPDPFISQLPKLSILILVVFLVDQIKVAMFRFNLSDYQQIVFVLFGGLLAAAWIAANHTGEKPAA